MTSPEQTTTPNSDLSRYADILIGAALRGSELRTTLLDAADQAHCIPEAERYTYLHELADKCASLVGSQQIPGGSMHIRTGTESYIMKKALQLPGIARQPERLRDTHVRLFSALTQDLSDLPPRTDYHGSAINRLHDETKAALQQSATAVLTLTPDTSEFSVVRDQAKHSFTRPAATHIQSVQVAPEYL